MERSALIATDDRMTGQLGSMILREAGLEVSIVESRSGALQMLRDKSFDLYLVYANECKREWLEFVKQARGLVANPILMVVSYGSEMCALDAYKSGVDEFIMMPFSAPLFLAKVRAWLRHSWAVPALALQEMVVGACRLIPERREFVGPDGSRVKLTNLEFRVLYMLMAHAGQVITSTSMVERAWDHEDIGDSASLKNVIYRLRRKLSSCPGAEALVQTIPGEGYAFKACKEQR